MPEFRASPTRARSSERSDSNGGWTPREAEGPPEARPTGKCPLCGEERKLDYHHWDYEQDVGVHICRNCHNYIHNPEGAKPSESQGQGWLYVTLALSVMRYAEYHEYVKPGKIVRDLKIPRRHEHYIGFVWAVFPPFEGGED
jgi:hypothetical protein